MVQCSVDWRHVPCYAGGMKVVQLNVEGSKHLERWLPFLYAEEPDVVCLQEVFQSDLAHVGAQLGMQSVFAPMTEHVRFPDTDFYEVQGIGILARMPFLESAVRWYYGGTGAVPRHSLEDRDSVWQPLLSAMVHFDGVPYTFATTHFMKSWDGAPDAYQRKRLPMLLDILASHAHCVVTGDFNIPRGTDLYHVLARRYKDHVPPEYENSLDPILHRIPSLRYMIDYVWSTPEYCVRNVRMVCGLSDHCALVGEVVRGE